MATYNFELNNKPTKKGTYVILFRITENKKHRRIKTPIELNSINEWNPKKQEVRTNNTDYKLYNEKLRKIKRQAEDTEEEIEKNKIPTSDNIMSEIKARKKTFSFIEFADEFADETKQNGDYRTYTKYQTFLNKLKYFINGIKPQDIKNIPHSGEKLITFQETLKKDLMFNDITYSFLIKFKNYLKKIPNTKHPELTLNKNTISKQFDNFKSLYNKGLIRYREDGLSIKINPFLDFSCDKEETSKEKLTSDEIGALNMLEIEKDSLLWHTRNCFMFAFYTFGMRAGDLIQLRGTNIIKKGDSYRIFYKMDKTAKSNSILLMPEAIDILKNYVNFRHLTSNYIFPLLDNEAPYAKAITHIQKEQLPYQIKINLLQQVNAKNSLLNKYLSKLATMAGINKKISMHIARHSFADIARQRNINLYDISKALGHSNLSITENYLSKFDEESLDASMKKAYDEVENDNKQAASLIEQLKSLSPEALAEVLNKLKE